MMRMKKQNENIFTLIKSNNDNMTVVGVSATIHIQMSKSKFIT